MLFGIKESYKIRHQILKSLFEHAELENDPQRPQIRVSLREISRETHIPYDKIRTYHEVLHEEEEIDCLYPCGTRGDHDLLLLTKGRQSYIYEKYLREGEQKRNEHLKDMVSIFSPIISVVISIISIFIAISALNKANDKVYHIQLQAPIIHMQTTTDPAKSEINIYNQIGIDTSRK